jgi:predicted RNase H-like HicB family nuclease
MNIWWSEEDECFVGEIPELPGCMADGFYQVSVACNLEKAAMRWIEAAQKLGWDIPEPRKSK